MKTAMQILIDYAIDKYGSDSTVANDLICQAMILKKEEKEQIENSFFVGQHGRHIEFNNYYKDIYKK